MLCRKAKNAEGKGVANFFATHLRDFRHPLKKSLPRPARIPESAPDMKHANRMGLEIRLIAIKTL